MNATRWWLLGLAAASAVAFSAGRLSVRPSPAGDPLREFAVLSFDWLGLTPAQAAEIARMEPAFRQTVESGCDRQCAARCRLVHQLAADDWDADQARAHVEAMCAAQRKIELAAVDFIERVRPILSTEQRARLMERVARCLCERCATSNNYCCEIQGE